MASPFDQTLEFQTPGAGPPAAADWFGQGSELAALIGPSPAQSAKIDKASATVIAADATTAQVDQAIKQRPQPLDLASLIAGDKRVVFFGERHDDLDQKDEIIRNLLHLKEKAGLTHVALEMLSADDMPAVRNYFDGTGPGKAVLERLKEKWSVAPGVPEKYMQLIDAVKEAKLIPLALDQPPAGKDDNRGSLFHDRNEHWAEVVSDTLKADSNAKVLVYMGRDHIGYTGKDERANEILKNDFGYDSTVVDFTSKIDSPDTIEGKVGRAAKEARLQDKQFALGMDTANPQRPCDILLHAPD